MSCRLPGFWQLRRRHYLEGVFDSKDLAVLAVITKLIHQAITSKIVKSKISVLSIPEYRSPSLGPLHTCEIPRAWNMKT